MSSQRDTVLLAGLTFSCAILAGALLKSGASTLLEAVGFVSGAIAVWLTVKENIWNWPIGILNSATYVIVFFNQRLFADGGLNVLYVVLGFWGWYAWLYGGENRRKLTITRSPKWEYAALLAVGVLATYGMTAYLVAQKDAAPFWDALTTVLSLIAQYQLTRKYIENWVVWIIADLIYVPLYAWKGLYLTAILYAAFTVMAIIGLRTWSQLRSQPSLGGTSD